jgi:hypothetical protein
VQRHKCESHIGDRPFRDLVFPDAGPHAAPP